MINRMSDHDGRILLIENDPQISQLIAEQTLKPLGYQVDLFKSGSAVVQELEKIVPDVIITDLNLPGLSCKDLLVALTSIGINVPVIVIANKGQEADILQTFRLGAVDFLFCPIRETEVIAVIENAFSKQQARKELENSSQKLDQARMTLERQVDDFSEIFSFIKQAWPSTDPGLISEQAIALAIILTEADSAWWLTEDANQTEFILRACHNVPEAMQSRLNLSYEDELSSLTAVSEQVLSMHGDTLKHITGFEWTGAVLAVPVTYHGKVCSLITCARNDSQPFTANQEAMLKLAAEYAWILWENSQRLHQLEQSQVYLKQASIHATLESYVKYDLLRQASLELSGPLKILIEKADALLDEREHKLHREQLTFLNDIQEEAEILMDISDSLLISRQEESMRFLANLDLNEAVRNVVNRFRPIAQMGKIVINLELPSAAATIKVYPTQITKVIEGLLSNALKYSPANGEVTITVDQDEHNTTLTVTDQGDGIDDALADRVFEVNSGVFGYSAKRFGGIGISLAAIREIISAYKGRIWVDKLQGAGFTIAFSLPRG